MPGSPVSSGERPFAATVGDPSGEPTPITPNNAADNVPTGVRFLYVGAAGALEWTGFNGTTVIQPVAMGYHPIRPVRILANNTTATSILAFT